MKTQTPFPPIPRRRREGSSGPSFYRSHSSSSLRRSLTCSRSGIPGPPARPADRDLRAHGRGGEDPGGVPSLVRRRGEGTVHPRRRTEGSRRANRARRFPDSRRGPLAHPRGRVVPRIRSKTPSPRNPRWERGRYSSVMPRHLRLPTSPARFSPFARVLPKDVALSAIRVRPEGGAGATWRWARRYFIEGWKYWGYRVLLRWE